MLASGADEAAASAALAASDSSVKLSIVMLKAGLGAEAAQARLDAAGGSIEAALRG
jgi:N-acetylmuramic acid 6-phosphate etherase